jgi:hypothetical protein
MPVGTAWRSTASEEELAKKHFRKVATVLDDFYLPDVSNCWSSEATTTRCRCSRSSCRTDCRVPRQGLLRSTLTPQPLVTPRERQLRLSLGQEIVARHLSVPRDDQVADGWGEQLADPSHTLAR